MQLPSNIDPHELLRYAQDEINRNAEALRAERQAIRDSMLEEIEAQRVANVKADLEREAQECPGGRVAAFLTDKLGEAWPEFIRLFRAATLTKLAAAVNRIEAERGALARWQNVEVAATTRTDAKAALVEARRTRVEANLAAAGVRVDWTSDADEVAA